MSEFCNVCLNKPKYRGYKICYDCFRKKYHQSVCPICKNIKENKAKMCRVCWMKQQSIDFDNRRPWLTCHRCGKQYKQKRLKTGFLYCSKSCCAEAIGEEIAKGGEHSPAWNGMLTKEASGYITIHDRSHKRRRRVHTILAETILGRPIRRGEVVHHINLDKSDNRNCNLLICSQSYHLWLHNAMASAWVKEHLMLEQSSR